MESLYKIDNLVQPVLLVPVVVTVLTFIMQTLILTAFTFGLPDEVRLLFTQIKIDLLAIVGYTILLNIITVIGYMALSLFYGHYWRKVLILSALPFINIPIVIAYIFLIIN